MQQNQDTQSTQSGSSLSNSTQTIDYQTIHAAWNNLTKQYSGMPNWSAFEKELQNQKSGGSSRGSSSSS